jgi:hypothetical protein
MTTEHSYDKNVQKKVSLKPSGLGLLSARIYQRDTLASDSVISSSSVARLATRGIREGSSGPMVMESAMLRSEL